MHAHAHAHTHRAPPFVPPVVRLDGVEITPVEIAAEMQHHPASEAAAAWQQAAEALLVRRLLLNEAARLGMDATPEGDETAEDAQVRRLLAAELRMPEADEATCRRWYAANRARFRAADAWEATHLLIAADPEDAAARAEAREVAEAALVQCKANPARLAELALALSDCPSREDRGDLGLVQAGSTVPAFEAALRATAEGALHDAVVETRYGFHVIHLRRHIPGEEQPFESVSARIAAWLREAAWRRAAHQYMTLLATRAAVEGLALPAGADGPLVQ